MKLTQVQTAVEEVSQVPVVSVGKVIFRTSPLLYTKPLGSLTVAVIVVLIPTVVIEESMKKDADYIVTWADDRLTISLLVSFCMLYSPFGDKSNHCHLLTL